MKSPNLLLLIKLSYFLKFIVKHNLNNNFDFESFYLNCI